MGVPPSSFSVRAAKTISWLAESSSKEAFDHPRAVTIAQGGELVRTTAHACRMTRRGHQTLVCLEGHLTWVASQRVRVVDDRSAIRGDRSDELPLSR